MHLIKKRSYLSGVLRTSQCRLRAVCGAAEEAAALFPSHLLIPVCILKGPAWAPRRHVEWREVGPSRLGDAAAPWEKGPTCWGAKPPHPTPLLNKTKKKKKEKSLKFFTWKCLSRVQQNMVGVSVPGKPRLRASQHSAAWAVSRNHSLPAGFWAQPHLTY